MNEKNKKDLPELTDEQLRDLVQGAREAFRWTSLDKFVDEVMRELNRPGRDPGSLKYLDHLDDPD